VQAQKTAIVIDEQNIQKAQMTGMQLEGKLMQAAKSPEAGQVAEEIETQVAAAETRVEMSLNKLFQPLLQMMADEIATTEVSKDCKID
jgi:hypothetical protein